MRENLSIIWTESEFDKRFYIDVPFRTVIEGEKLIRMEIPRSLAEYIFYLKNEITDLKCKLGAYQNEKKT